MTWDPSSVRGQACRTSFPIHSGLIEVNMDTPLLKLNLPDASATCLDWMTGTRLVVGLSNGLSRQAYAWS